MSINLLPPDILVEQLKKAKFYKVQLAGIAVILIMIFLASLSIALRILQSQNITVAQAKLEEDQQRISGFRGTQASLFILKDRLNIIGQYLGVPSKQSAIYQLIDRLIPSTVSVNAITVTKEGDIVLLVLTPNAEAVDDLISNMTTKENNEDKISQVSIESLNRGRDGLYRVSLKVKAK